MRTKFYTHERLALFVVIALIASNTLALGAGAADGKTVWLESLNLDNMNQDWDAPMAGRSADNHPLTLKGVVYEHGVGTHANSRMTVDLKGEASRFSATVGVDDETKDAGSVVFQIYLDNKKVVDSGMMRPGAEPKHVSLDLAGAKTMVLVATDAGDGIVYDHADWASAYFEMNPSARSAPESVFIPCTPPIPMAFGVSDKPEIHGPRIVGATPSRPFLFRTPATGSGPLSFRAKDLPAGLSLDSRTGIISGSLKAAGRYVVELTVNGPLGSAKRKLVIVGGEHQLALTPPMGWNSWNVWAGAVDDAKVRAAADWMVKSGLAVHGFQYINIDDTWEAGRNANGEIQTNAKFPDMKALADYVHSKGLKLGIYSSPGPKTCGGFAASYQHEDQDAATYAKWGIDYLKYDWCSYGDVATGSGDEKLQKPYAVMRASLDKVNRDIVFSFCQYGMGDVWKWGARIGGNCWRTTGDIGDTWGSLSDIAFSQDGREQFAGPGHWNDPDMLEVGRLGGSAVLHRTRLTPSEQVLHITAWSLLAAPLLIGCDMSKLDDFTMALLSNDEVLDVNQDPLGKPSKCIAKVGDAQVWARPLWDGTMAFGFMNRGYTTQVAINWSDLGLSGPQPVRDLWQKKDLGTFDKSFSAQVPTHGALLYRVGTPNRTDW